MKPDRAGKQGELRSPRLRILAISPTFLPVQGGAERLLDEVLRRIAVHHDLTLLTAEPPARHAGPLPPDLPFPVHRYADRWTMERLRGRRWHQGYAPPFSLSAAVAALRLARELRPDAVHVHYAIPTGLAGWMAARAVRVPWVLSFIGRDIPGPGVAAGWRAWDRRMVAAADSVTYISDYCRRALFGDRLEGPGVTVGAGVAPPPAVPPEVVLDLRRRLGIGGDRPVLLCLQRLVAYKGVEVLVDMMGHLVALAGDSRDRRPVLLIAGNGPEREHLARRVAEQGLADRVWLLGFVPDTDMPALWALADVFVFHSRYETFGLAVAEAMAAGKAVVAARTTAIPEVLRDGIDGLLVPPDDPGAFAGAVGGLLADPGRRAAMGSAGQARARAEFNWDRVADDYRVVIEQAARRRI
jgi:glycosyltransferase involved in cell wall biosynthesis